MDTKAFADFVKKERERQPTVMVDNTPVKVIDIKEHKKVFDILTKDAPKINITAERMKFAAEWFRKAYCDGEKISFVRFKDTDTFEHLPFRKGELEITGGEDEESVHIMFYRGEYAKEIVNSIDELENIHCMEFIQLFDNKWGRLGAYNLDVGMFRTNDPDDYKFMHMMQIVLVMLVFIRDYAEVIHHREVTETSTKLQTKRGKLKYHKINIIRKVYDIDDELITYVKHHHRYTKPTKEFDVRGYYRTMKKSGKKVWVNGFTKYKDAGVKQKQEYIV